MQWFKVASDMFDDKAMKFIEKIKPASKRDSVEIIWIKLLCLAGNDESKDGMLGFDAESPYTVEMIADLINRTVREVKAALAVLEQYRLIEVGESVTIRSWEKHQSIEELEHKRELTRKRVAKHRKRNADVTECNADGNALRNVTSNADVTECNATELELEKELEKECLPIVSCNERKAGNSSNQIPTLDDVRRFVADEHLFLDAEVFFRKNEERGWMVGSQPIRDWKALARSWAPMEFGNHVTSKRRKPIETPDVSPCPVCKAESQHLTGVVYECPDHGCWQIGGGAA